LAVVIVLLVIVIVWHISKKENHKFISDAVMQRGQPQPQQPPAHTNINATKSELISFLKQKDDPVVVNVADLIPDKNNDELPKTVKFKDVKIDIANEIDPSNSPDDALVNTFITALDKNK
jgi:hypothetical protein